MIAMALANEPDLFIADEPTTALDVTVQAQILELLQRLQKQLGMAMLLITHDLGIVRKMADDVCVMLGGKIIEAGPVQQVFDHPHEDYTRHLLESEPKGRPRAVAADAPVVLSGEGYEGLVSAQAPPVQPRRRIMSRQWMAFRCRCGRAKPWALWANPVREKPRLVWPFCG